MCEHAGSCADGCVEIMLDIKYHHKALDVITDYPPPSLITSARMTHEIAIAFNFVAMSKYQTVSVGSIAIYFMSVDV